MAVDDPIKVSKILEEWWVHPNIRGAVAVVGATGVCVGPDLNCTGVEKCMPPHRRRAKCTVDPFWTV